MATHSHTLKNGMQVVMVEDHASPVISFNALVKVGSADETDAEAGICHVIEHMLFKGTPTRPLGTIAHDVEAAGGEINAYTSIDQTVFFINMASRFADKGLAILADAVKNPLFDAAELEREKEVILEEIRREHDNPGRMCTEYLFQLTFSKHTYGRPIIGYPKTVKSFTSEELTRFHKKWYAPMNIAFVVVGNFDRAKMLKEIEIAFADHEGAGNPASSAPEEPAQTKPRVKVATMSVQNTNVGLGFHVPSVRHEDVPAIDVLGHILGGSESSRLEQEIKEKKRLVHGIYAYPFTPKHPGIFIIGAALADKDVVRALEAITHEIERIKTHGVSSEELAMAKLNIKSDQIYDKESVGGHASRIASFISSAGSYEFETEYYRMIADVSLADVSDAAKRYLTHSNCSVVVVSPEKTPWAKSAGRIADAITPTFGKKKGTRQTAKPKVVRKKLGSGLTVLVQENHRLPIVAVNAVSLGGTRSERRSDNGISNLMTRLLVKGTATRKAIQIAKDSEKIAGDVLGYSGKNTCGVKADFLSDYMGDGFELFFDVMTNPSFEPSEIMEEKRIALKAIEDHEDVLSSRTFTEFLETLYTKHPYGLKALGTKATIKAIDRDALIAYHRKILSRKNMILAVVGDVNSDEVMEIVERAAQNIPSGRANGMKIAADKPPSKPKISTVVKKHKQQAHIVLGFMGTTYKSKDRYAMTVMNNILSGQGGRLFRVLRDQMSLAYAISSVNSEGIEPGYFAVYIGTEPSKVETAIDGMLGELAKIRASAVTKEELERSKQYLVGTYELELQKCSSLASLYSFNEIYGLGIDEVERYPQMIMAVTADDILNVAEKYIKLDAYTMAVVKPA